MRDNRKKYDISAQSGYSSKTIHNTGVQHRKIRSMQDCLFFFSLIRRKMKKRPAQDAVQDRQRVKQQKQSPGRFRTAQPCSAKIVQKKCRADIVAESQQITSFFRRNVAAFHQIRSDFCPHGKSAQKTSQDHIASGFGDVKYFFQDMGIGPVQYMKQARMYQQSGQNHERKQRRQDRGVPEIQTAGASGGDQRRMGENQKQCGTGQAEEKYLFQEATI